MYKNLLNIIIKNKFIIILLFELFFVYFIVLNNIFSNRISFWYDTARDLLLALENLRKPTLIGNPTGIPGIFYGPYWIWLLSLALFVTKNPATVTLYVLVIPYLIVFPFILVKFNKIIDIKVSLVLFLAFLMGYYHYILQLWNPHFAPFLILLLIYLIVFNNSKRFLKNLLQIFISGVVAGLILNFTMSFGLGVLLGSAVFFIAEFLSKVFIRKDKEFVKVLIENFSKILTFVLGVFIVFLPFLLFEYRHGFNQIQSAYKTIVAATAYNSAVVGQSGFTKNDILQFFLGTIGRVLDIPPIIYFPLLIIILLYIVQVIIKRQLFIKEESKLILLLSLISVSVLFIYLTSKNPVWEYHFIGSEIIFILLIGVVASKNFYLKNLLFLWVTVLFMYNIPGYIEYFKTDKYKVESLLTKRHTVEQIIKNASGKDYAVFVYNPAIYTFDYDYIFNWYEGKDRKLQKDIEKAQNVYLIIPKVSEAIREDFINYKTPKEKYENEELWLNSDGTQVIKRKLKKVTQKKSNL